MEEQKAKKVEKASKKLIAKKDWVIVQNDERYEIKKGDEVEVPKKFIDVLKTENVI